MCTEIVALTATGASYCQAAGGRDGLCAAHRREREHPAPGSQAGRVREALAEVTEIARAILVEGGMSEADAARVELRYDGAANNPGS